MARNVKKAATKTASERNTKQAPVSKRGGARPGAGRKPKQNGNGGIDIQALTASILEQVMAGLNKQQAPEPETPQMAVGPGVVPKKNGSRPKAVAPADRELPPEPAPSKKEPRGTKLVESLGLIIQREASLRNTEIPRTVADAIAQQMITLSQKLTKVIHDQQSGAGNPARAATFAKTYIAKFEDLCREISLEPTEVDMSGKTKPLGFMGHLGNPHSKKGDWRV